MAIRLMTRVWDEGPDDRTETIVLLCLADHANDEGHAYPSLDHIAERCRLSRQAVTNVLGRLQEKGWIVKESGGGRGNPNQYHIRLDRFDKRSSSLDGKSSEKGKADSQKGKADKEKGKADKAKGSSSLDGNRHGTVNNRQGEPRKGDDKSTPPSDDHPENWKYDHDDWRWVAAEWALTHLEKNGMLNSHYRKRLQSERRGKVASEWADELRKIVELDGYTREEVRLTLAWLFQTDNWWKQKRTIQSLNSLRKKDDSKTTKFDKIAQSALADYEQRQRETTTAEDVIREWDRAISEVEDELEEEFADAGGDTASDERELAEVTVHR